MADSMFHESENIDELTASLADAVQSKFKSDPEVELANFKAKREGVKSDHGYVMESMKAANAKHKREMAEKTRQCEVLKALEQAYDASIVVLEQM